MKKTCRGNQSVLFPSAAASGSGKNATSAAQTSSAGAKCLTTQAQRLGDSGVIELNKAGPKLYVSAHGKIQSGNRVVDPFKVKGALLAKVVKVAVLVGLANKRRNVVEVLRLDRTVLEVPGCRRVANP